MQAFRTSQARLAATIGAALAFAAMAAWIPAQAQALDANGIGRTEVVRKVLDAKHEAVQVRVDFGPGASFPKHVHPGAEIAYVLEGSVEYEVGGKPVVLKAGQSLFIPAGTVHAARNPGAGHAAELATYLVEKGKPIVVLSQ